jgi:GT2 family glycosyltransferase
MLSVVIVNYNVKEFLEQCLNSVIKSAAGLPTEIFVVDNNSVDGSQDMLCTKFANRNFAAEGHLDLSVHLILNTENVGFGRANNQALRQCKGEYVLVLNPDTVLQEDTLTKMTAFMETDKTIGVAGCKLLNADGTFQLACRRSFPSPEVSFYKIIGLSTLFPKSKRFARYNLTYLPTDQTYEVDALMGAFMFLRKEIIEQVGMFDESFFMYGEDLDWCYRIKQAGWKVYYYHGTQIIHYKGESTKKNSVSYVIRFYEAMLIFVRKHYSGKYSKLFEWVLMAGIYARAMAAFLRRFLETLRNPLLDLLLIMLSVVIGFKYKFAVYPNAFLEVVLPAYTLIWMATLTLVGQYRLGKHYSLKKLFTSLLIGFLISTTLTFFFKQYAFSRVGLTASYLIANVLLAGWRIFTRVVLLKRFTGMLDAGKRVVIVGTDAEALRIAGKLQHQIKKNYTLVGFVTQTERIKRTTAFSEQQVLGSLKDIAEIITVHKINDVVFAASEISNTQILAAITRCDGLPVNFKIVPVGLEVMIGKSAIDELSGEMNLIEINYNIRKPSVQLAKRGFDVGFAIVSFLLFPFWLLARDKKSIFQNLVAVVKGKKSVVGASRNVMPETSVSGVFVGKTGMFTLAGISQAAVDAEQADIYYARNASLGLDLEIIFKSIFKK